MMPNIFQDGSLRGRLFFPCAWVYNCFQDTSTWSNLFYWPGPMLLQLWYDSCINDRLNRVLQYGGILLITAQWSNALFRDSFACVYTNTYFILTGWLLHEVTGEAFRFYFYNSRNKIFVDQKWQKPFRLTNAFNVVLSPAPVGLLFGRKEESLTTTCRNNLKTII